MRVAQPLLVLVLLAAAGQLLAEDAAKRKVARAEFVSCPGCRLNRLPEVKRFLRTVIQPGEYPRTTVEFIPGRVPELFLYDAEGKEIERMFIEHLSFAELHTLMETKGFKQKSLGGTRRTLLGDAGATTPNEAGKKHLRGAL